MGVAETFFISAVMIEILYGWLFIRTIRNPPFRFWPPPSARSWQFFAAWLLAGWVIICVFVLALFDFNSFILPRFLIRLPVVIAMMIVSQTIGLWALFTFGLTATTGLGQKLITHGPYRYTRNPQYISDSLTILAFFVLTNSWMVGVVGLLGIGLNYLAPFTEESWLEERFGAAYLEYKRAVPRFIPAQFRPKQSRTARAG
jgi:protein-S-isoprenylcysteine O-methyltransferase Ste14